MKSSSVLYPPGLYRGILWQKDGNNKLLYCGVQDMNCTYTMTDIRGLRTVKLILGDINLPSSGEREGS